MKITNWEKWQTFRKDRSTPPWIKIYRNLLSNIEWVSLTDSEKGQLVSIWILAADKNGEIPEDPVMIQRMSMLDKKPNLNKFIDLGFMTTSCQPDGNHEINSTPQHDAPEESRDRVEKSRVEKKRFTPPTLEEIKKHIQEKKYSVNPLKFYNHYESNGWMVGKNKMKSWTAALGSWNAKEGEDKPKPPQRDLRRFSADGTMIIDEEGRKVS